MKGHSDALEFLKHSQISRELSKQILEAVSKGGMVTAEEVMKVAKKAGYSFTREEFETAVRSNIVERFRAGEYGLASVVNANDPPESSCAKGCLSYTVSYHPDPSIGGPAIDPIPFIVSRR
jgi:Nif11 domain